MKYHYNKQFRSWYFETKHVYLMWDKKTLHLELWGLCIRRGFNVNCGSNYVQNKKIHVRCYYLPRRFRTLKFYVTDISSGETQCIGGRGSFKFQI